MNNLTQILVHWCDLTGSARPLYISRWVEQADPLPDLDAWENIMGDEQSLAEALDLVTWPEGAAGPSASELFAMLPQIDAIETARMEAAEIAQLRREISIEAERRIEQGLEIPNAGLFRARTQDITRLQGLLKAAELAEANQELVDVTFMTEAGNSVTVTSAAEIAAIFEAASNHISFVLKRSAQLQEGLSAMTAEERAAFEAGEAVHWT